MMAKIDLLSKIDVYEKMASHAWKKKAQAFTPEEAAQWDSQTEPKGIPAPDPALGDQPPPLTPPKKMDAPAPREQDKPTPTPATIPTNVQQALGGVLVAINQGIPIQPTGKLDQSTQWALNKFKQLVPSAANLTGKALYDKIIDSHTYAYYKGKEGKSESEIAQGLKSGETGAMATNEKMQLNNKSLEPAQTGVVGRTK